MRESGAFGDGECGSALSVGELPVRAGIEQGFERLQARESGSDVQGCQAVVASAGVGGRAMFQEQAYHRSVIAERGIVNWLRTRIADRVNASAAFE